MSHSKALKRKFGDVSTVALLVGPHKTAFHVHEDLLCEHSIFFKTAFASHWKESTERTMALPEDDPDLFEPFTKWLYLQTYAEIDDLDFVRKVAHRSEFIMKSCQLFVLAEKYDVVRLRNAVIRAMYSERKHVDTAAERALTPSRAALGYAYENTPQKSNLRRLLVDWVTWHVNLEWYENDDVQDWLLRIPELAVDLVAAFASRMRHSKQASPLVSGVEKYYEDLGVLKEE